MGDYSCVKHLKYILLFLTFQEVVGACVDSPHW